VAVIGARFIGETVAGARMRPVSDGAGGGASARMRPVSLGAGGAGAPLRWLATAAAAPVALAFERFPDLEDKVAAETTPLDHVGDDERWWVWVCPTGDFSGRLHVAGYARESHALYTVCPEGGHTFLR